MIPPPNQRRHDARGQKTSREPLGLIDQLLAHTPDEDPRHELLYALRQRVLEGDLTLQQTRAEIRKLNEVVEKVTAPANRIGTLLGLPEKDLAHIAVGGADYYTNIDPRIKAEELGVGVRVLVNEAFVVIGTIGEEPGGVVTKVTDCLPDGRLRVGQEPGLQASILLRSHRLVGADLKVGDEVRVDSSHRVAIEKVQNADRRDYFLEETPDVTWERIGGQQPAIEAIRNALEQPLLYPDLFKRYEFTQPKGFLLYGPPGCGKTMIGKATAGSLVAKLREQGQERVEEFFIHVKGPEILNMWLGESERMVREIFARAREKRGSGFFPFIFIDEAESILGTRRSGRANNILTTLVPMFCAELDGIESLKEMVVILASNRPDMIDPAILRPGRIDRKIKIARPDRTGSREILGIYLTSAIPLRGSDVKAHGDDPDRTRGALIEAVLQAIFGHAADQRVLELHLRSGRRDVMYRQDLISGAILASVVQRAKERAIRRAIAGEEDGVGMEDCLLAVESEYREGEILPPNDHLEEWLKLIDADPESVAGISLFGHRASPAVEKRVI